MDGDKFLELRALAKLRDDKHKLWMLLTSPKHYMVVFYEDYIVPQVYPSIPFPKLEKVDLYLN